MSITEENQDNRHGRSATDAQAKWGCHIMTAADWPDESLCGVLTADGQLYLRPPEKNGPTKEVARLEEVVHQLQKERATLLMDLLKMRQERESARSQLERALELASPFTHPEQWVGYLHVVRGMIRRWK